MSCAVFRTDIYFLFDNMNGIHYIHLFSYDLTLVLRHYFLNKRFGCGLDRSWGAVLMEMNPSTLNRNHDINIVWIMLCSVDLTSVAN